MNGIGITSFGRQQTPGTNRLRLRTAGLALALLVTGAAAVPSTARAAREAAPTGSSAAVVSLAVAGSWGAAAAVKPPTTIGGYQSKYGPWAVRMLVDGKAHCTGTAITDQWIISASHCFFGLPDQPVKDKRITFRVGNLDERKGTLVRPIAGSRVQDPDGSDVMLIKVSKMKIPTAKLSAQKVKPGQRVRVFGWDATCLGNENTCESDLLRQADLEVLSYKQKRCSGFGSSSGSDFCSTTVRGLPTGGDSGAPVMTSAPAGKELMVGVMWGSDRQSMIGSASIFNQLKWIHKITGKSAH